MLILALFCYRERKRRSHVQFEAAAQKEAQVSNGLHQPPNIRIRETVPVPEVPVSGGPGRNSRPTRPDQRPSHHLVPEQAGQTQEGHGRAEEGRRNGQSLHAAQDFLGERSEFQHTEEETFWFVRRGQTVVARLGKIAPIQILLSARL